LTEVKINQEKKEVGAAKFIFARLGYWIPCRNNDCAEITDWFRFRKGTV